MTQSGLQLEDYFMLKAKVLLTTLIVFSAYLLSQCGVQAQDKPVPAPSSNSQEEVFADFESGTYEGWTLEGNCWLSEPASTQTFLDPRTKQSVVVGIGGKRFLVSFHRNAAETGKAISREFTITKPFVNFLIGGGNHPKQACLNLVVDGNLARTATGNGNNELRQASWDVSLLIGKKAHLEVVDTTQSQDHGYIMVDDILFSSLPRDKSLLDIESGPTLKQFGITNGYFMEHSPIPFSQPYGKNDLRPLFDFGVTPQVLLNLINTAAVNGYRLQHDPIRSVQKTAQLLCLHAESLLDKAGIIKPKLLLKQWLIAEEICGYVYSNVGYDLEGLKATPDRATPMQERPFTILAMPNPRTICGGYGKVTTELAFAAGLKCCTINGIKRNWDGPVVHDDGHSWNLFEFDGGIRVPADTTPMYQEEGLHPKVVRSTINFKVNWRTLPCTPRMWEAYMREYWPHQIRWAIEGPFQSAGISMFGDKNQHNSLMDIHLYNLNWEEWLSFNSKPYWDLEHWYVHEFYGKNRLQ